MSPTHLLNIVTGLTLAATVTLVSAQEPSDGFLCCNMRSNGSWISDSNYAESGKRIIQIGTPIIYKGLGSNRVLVEIEGKRQAIGNDYSRDIALEAFARRYIVKDDPRAKLEAMPAKLRRAIETARVTRGMTKDQVVMAMGYPISSENPHLDAKRWRYWLWSFSPFTILFDEAGAVSHIETDPNTLVKVFLE